MTEEEWLSETNPEEMIRKVGIPISERKLRFFALACCRRVDHFITDPRSQAALRFVETYVEATPNRKKGRPVVEKEARTAHAEAYVQIFQQSERDRPTLMVASNAADAAHSALGNDPIHAAIYAAAFAAHAFGWNEVEPDATNDSGWEEKRLPEQAAQADLLREIVGNPFRPRAVDPLWLRWHDGTVVNLAQTIYSEAAFDRLGILADALEDAGCTETDILNHLRSPAPHVRGCWALDCILGRT